MNAVFVGIDSGVAWTRVEVVWGTQSRRYPAAATMSGAMDPALYEENLRGILAPLDENLARMGAIGVPIYMFMSTTAFTPRVREDFLRAFAAVCPTVAHGKIAAVGVGNDAVVLLLGYNAQVAVVADAGSSTLIRRPSGEITQVGGHEWVAADNGSAFWIGLRSIRQAYRDLESGSSNSMLIQSFLRTYNLRAGDENALIATLRSLSVADSNMKMSIAKFASEVCSAAEFGDQDSQDIVKSEAEDLADMVAGGLRRAGYSAALLASGLRVVQYGEMMDNDFYRRYFEAQLEMRLRSDPGQRADLRWSRAGGLMSAAVSLAETLPDSTRDLSPRDEAFRLAVLRF